MENLVEFIGDNYAWFLTITIILLFALIGYIYDSKRNKSDLVKKRENELEEESLENLRISEEKSLANMVVNSKNINPETKTVELVDPNILQDNNPKEMNNSVTNASQNLEEVVPEILDVSNNKTN